MHLSAYVCAVVEAMNRSMNKHFWQWAFVYMFELLWRVRINLRLGILKRSFMFMFVLLKRVCKNVKLGILATITCVYICVGIDGMCTCKTGKFWHWYFCLYFFCCRGYVHMLDWACWKWAFVFMFVLLYLVYTHDW